MLVLGERRERGRGKKTKSQQKSVADICQPAPLPNADKGEDSEREELVDRDDALTEAQCNLLRLQILKKQSDATGAMREKLKRCKIAQGTTWGDAIDILSKEEWKIFAN